MIDINTRLTEYISAIEYVLDRGDFFQETFYKDGHWYFEDGTRTYDEPFKWDPKWEDTHKKVLNRLLTDLITTHSEQEKKNETRP